VLVVEDYKEVTPPLQKQYKIDIRVSPASKVIFVTGGSLGARTINLAMVRIVPELLHKFPDLHIIHQVGKGNSKVYGEYSHHRLSVLEFVQPLSTYMGAADIIVTRAGGTAIAEAGVQAKATIMIPNPILTGGHQLKNAQYLLQHAATEVVNEADIINNPLTLIGAIERLLQDSNKRQNLGQKLKSLTIPDAAQRLALLLLESAK
jgi:UDP-N-acetylglucosamine--N-acetylmuramyl-(pentapeptide) pyrophosphoryl-undecaprenol N-acetylglucosamine transferase